MTSTRAAMAMLRAANPVPAPAPRAARARRRPLVLLVGATAAASVLAVTLGGVPLPWALNSATPAAADALDRAASAADITALDPSAAADQYWKITTEGESLVGSSEDDRFVYWLEQSTRTDYAAVDGSRPTWIQDGPGTVTAVFNDPDVEVGEVRDNAETYTSNLAPNDVPGSWQGPNAAWLAELPRDPGALRERLYDDTAGHGRSRDGEVLVYVADVLRSGIVPAELRAALFRVLETVPGVDIVARHDDGMISIGRLETVDGERQEIIIDPSTGAYVGERQTAMEYMDGAIPPGTVIYDVEVTTTLVDEVPHALRDRAQVDHCTVQGDGSVTCGQP